MSSFKRSRAGYDDDGYSPSNSPMSVGTSDVQMPNQQYMNKSYRYAKEVCDSFITKLITYYSMYSQENCDDEDTAPVKINDEYIANSLEAVKEAKNKLGKVVNDFHQAEEPFMLGNIKNWVRDVHLTPSSSKNTLVESAFLLFYTYDSRLMTVSEQDLLKYANEAADNILKFILKPGSNSNFDKDPIVRFVISPTANNTSNIIELSFGKLYMLFGSSAEEERQQSLYTGAGIFHNGECYVNGHSNISKYGFRRLIPDEKNVLPDGYGRTNWNHTPQTEDFKECLAQLKEGFGQEYNESELKTKIDSAALHGKEALKKIQKKYNFKSVEQFIHQIDDFKTTLENEGKKEGKKHEETPGAKNIHTEYKHIKKINSVNMNM